MPHKEHNCEFQVSIYRNGHLLLAGQFSPDKDATIEIMDAINQNDALRRKGFVASLVTKGNGGVNLA